MDAHAYQEERSNHECEKLSVVLFAYTVVKPLQKPRLTKELEESSKSRRNINKLRFAYPAMMIKMVNTFITNSTVLAVLENLHQNNNLNLLKFIRYQIKSQKENLRRISDGCKL
jgi:hypothetical protein